MMRIASHIDNTSIEARDDNALDMDINLLGGLTMNVTIGKAVGAAACAAFLIFTASGCSEGAGKRLAHAGGTAAPAALVDTPRWSADAEDRDFGLAVEANRRGVPYLAAFDVEDLDNAFDRIDYDHGVLSESTPAGFICDYGGRNSRYPKPAFACSDAHDEALAAANFDAAARYATNGCTRYKDLGSCRQLASLPIAIGNSGRPVAPSIAQQLREAAAATCASTGQLTDLLGHDVSGRECAHLARRFVLARDPEYRLAFAPHATKFFESIYEPQRAARLYETACQRLRHPAACADARRITAEATQR